MVWDLRSYSVLREVYNVYNVCIRKSKVAEFKMHNFKTVYALGSSSCLLIIVLVKYKIRCLR